MERSERRFMGAQVWQLARQAVNVVVHGATQNESHGPVAGDALIEEE
jgi:hypothetical protein